MSDDAALQSSFWLMVVMQTIGSVDMPGSGDRKMPPPRAYLATIVIWSVLQIASDAGYGKAARSSAWVIVLVGMVFGPFGQKIADLFVKIADIAAGQAESQQVPGAPGGTFDTSSGPAPFRPPKLTRTGSPTRPVGQTP